MYLTFHYLLTKAVHFSYDPQPFGWFSVMGQNQWTCHLPISSSGNALFLLVFLLFFIC